MTSYDIFYIFSRRSINSVGDKVNSIDVHVIFHLLQCGTVKIYKYIWRYLFRRIPHASHPGPWKLYKSFCYLKQRNILVGLKGKKAQKVCKFVTSRQSHHDQETNDRKHFIILLLFNQGSFHVQLSVFLTLASLFLLIL